MARPGDGQRPVPGCLVGKAPPTRRVLGTGYDWRKVEATLNELPQFITEIDGLDIQFAHIRSPYEDALPLLMTHGWPGSIIELLKVIEPLTNPTAHGGRAEDAFHLVLPTMPGYGFSGNPTSTGWSPARMASAFHELMLRLGYPQYVSQGGDWGAIISELLAVQAPEGLLGIHVNMPGTVPPDDLRHLRNFDPAPAEPSDRERIAYDRLLHFYRDGFGYAAMMNQNPQTIGYALADSPVGMAAYYYDKFAEWTDTGGEPEKIFTYDEMLDDAVRYYIDLFSDPDALRGSFGLYRAWDATLAQNKERTNQPLTMPVLAIGGAKSWGDLVGNVAANDVQTVVIPGAGHWVAETAPKEMLAALTAFLAPYRDGLAAVHDPGPRAATAPAD